MSHGDLMSSSNFMKGYRRTAAMTEALGAAVVAALREQPTQRLGQMLTNAMHLPDHGVVDWFNFTDERIHEALIAYLDNEPDAYGCLMGNIANGGCALVCIDDMEMPTSLQVADVMADIEALRTRLSAAEALGITAIKALSDALILLDRFDLYVQGDHEYMGSPLATQVQEFLVSRGKRAS